jgi:hypothetical protein
VGPADQNLSRGDGTDTEQVEEFGRQLPYEAQDLVLQCLGLGLQGLDALGGAPQRSCGHAVFDVVGRAVAQLGATRDLDQALKFPQLGAEVVRCGHDQGLELVDRGGGGEDRAVAGGEQAAIAAGAVRGIGAGQDRTDGADGGAQRGCRGGCRRR